MVHVQLDEGMMISNSNEEMRTEAVNTSVERIKKKLEDIEKLRKEKEMEKEKKKAENGGGKGD